MPKIKKVYQIFTSAYKTAPNDVKPLHECDTLTQAEKVYKNYGNDVIIVELQLKYDDIIDMVVVKDAKYD